MYNLHIQHLLSSLVYTSLTATPLFCSKGGQHQNESTIQIQSDHFSLGHWPKHWGLKGKWKGQVCDKLFLE